MCLTPYYIDNPHLGSRVPSIMLTKDTISSKIGVPCGHCSVCLQLKQAYFVQRVQCESMESDIYSCMLSYNNKYLPTIEINGYKHKYADSRDIQLFIKRLRNNNVFGSDFKFFAISEFGGKRHRPHWHILFFVPKPKVPYTLYEQWSIEESLKWKVLDEWYYNLGSKRKPIKDPLLTYKESHGKRNYDFHFVDPSLTDGREADIAFYTSKYLTKSSDYVKRLKSALYFNLDEADFSYYWNLIRPKTLSSIGLGLGLDNHSVVFNYLDDCINYSISNHFKFPVFVNPCSGQTFPMSPYLLHKRSLSFEEVLHFRYLNDEDFIPGTNVRIIEEVDPSVFRAKSDAFKRIQDKIIKRDISDYIDDDCDSSNDFRFFEGDIPRYYKFSNDFIYDDYGY